MEVNEFRRIYEKNLNNLMHEWKITAISQVGIGSEFIIKLPIKVMENSFKYSYKTLFIETYF